MIILGINASARKNGNCRTLLDEALKALKEAGCATETLCLIDLNISPWREVNPKDDMEKLIGKIKAADIIILAAPIYFGSLSAQAKIMIDRCQDLWEKVVLNKTHIRKNEAKAALICTQASDRKDFFENAEHIAKNFFVVIEAKYKGKLFCGGLENKTDALKHPEYIKEARLLAKTLLS